MSKIQVLCTISNMHHILLLIVATVASCHAASNHAIWGRVYLNDTLVYAEQVKVGSLWLTERELDVLYPPKVR